MKRIFTRSIIVLAAMIAFTTGCIKEAVDVDINDNSGGIPNVTDFHMSAASTFIMGASAAINITSTTMGDGDFTVNYSFLGSNVFTGNATMHMSGGSGSFNTQVLTNGGNTQIMINYITNSAGGRANITVNNTSSFFDSTGVMNVNLQIGDPFYATDVTASIVGSMLDIHGVMWDPDLRTTTLNVKNFNVAAIPMTVNFTNISQGSIDYSGPSTLKHAAHGTIIIQSLQSSVMSGTFSGTMEDSSTVSGNFQAKLN